MRVAETASISGYSKRLVAQSFDRAAEGYDAVADLQRAVGRGLLAAIADECTGCLLDVGAGTGFFSRVLADRYPHAQVVAVDIAEGMLQCARQRFSGPCVVGDAESLPLASGSVDLVFSNLAIQWCTRPMEVFGEFLRVLRPGGALLFSTFGPHTLSELRQAWQAADHFSHVNDFAGAGELRAVLDHLGFDALDLHAERRVLGYPDVGALMRELKGLGAHNLTEQRPRHLTGKGVFRRMLAAYPAAGEGIEASFEIFVGRCRKPEGQD